MGHLYALAGASGVGKTTFLNSLRSRAKGDWDLLVRATGRPLRPGEIDGVDYNFYSQQGFLNKIFSNDFVHVEQFGNNFYAIEASPIEESLASSRDGIILSGIYGAARLRAVYGANVSIVYMHTGTRRSLLDPECLRQDSPEVLELVRRLREKVEKGIVVMEPDKVDEYVASTMRLNFLNLAYVNGRIRSGEEICILENLRGTIDSAIDQFFALRRRTSGIVFEWSAKTNVCFVLMPFREDMMPVYEDHILPVVERLGLRCLRADKIFSNRPIETDVREAVKTARLIIADLTHANPNVLFETGMCYALGKQVILITQDSDVPFDVRHIRHIRYTYSPRAMITFESTLEKTLQTVMTGQMLGQ